MLFVGLLPWSCFERQLLLKEGLYKRQKKSLQVYE